ncbi:MAG: hypothetical protein ACPK7O_02650 [Methanobacterium sp.]
MIKNKTIAIIAALSTFIIGSILITAIIFYIAKIPLSSIYEGQNQLYLFSAILLSAVLASMLYGRGSKQRASDAAEFLNEKLDLGIKGEDIGGLLKLLEKFPSFVVNLYISKNINAVEEFKIPIKENTDELTDEDLQKVRKIIEMPIPELQKIMHELYLITNLEQLKILSEPQARQLIELNLEELKNLLFNE